MNETIFKKKNIDRISSPEKLDDLIYVARPPKRLVVIATIILLIGSLMWSVFVGFDTIIDDMGVDDFIEWFNGEGEPGL